LRLLLDEHFPPEIAERLREDLGHDVVSVSGTLRLEGKADAFLLDHAAGERRAIVTQDIRDFAALHSRYLQQDRTHYGIVFAPSRRFSRNKRHIGEIVRALNIFMRSHPLEDTMKDAIHWLQSEVP